MANYLIISGLKTSNALIIRGLANVPRGTLLIIRYLVY
jgi:hypothetical protein